MKVVFLSANFPPEAQGGTERVAAALGAALVARGHEVAVVTSSGVLHQGQDVLAAEHQGMRVWRLPRRADEWDASGFHRPRLLALVHDLLARERPELVHAHALSAFGPGCGAVCQQLSVPLVLTFHDLWVTCPRYFRLPPPGITCPTGADRTPCIACIDQVLRAPDPSLLAPGLAARDRAVRADVAAAAVLTAPSQTTVRLVQRHLPWSGEIAVVPHGVLQQARRSAAERRPGERLRIGSFGNLVAEKGVRELVQAVAGLDCELHLHGPFLDESFGREVRALAAAQRTVLVCHGPFAAEGPHPAAGLHLAVFPSLCQETYGLVVDEALSHRVPVVVSDRGALAERRATGGVVVTKVEVLADTLRALVQQPQELAALRAAIAPTLPTIADAAIRYVELYERALAARPGAPTGEAR